MWGCLLFQSLVLFSTALFAAELPVPVVFSRYGVFEEHAFFITTLKRVDPELFKARMAIVPGTRVVGDPIDYGFTQIYEVRLNVSAVDDDQAAQAEADLKRIAKETSGYVQASRGPWSFGAIGCNVDVPPHRLVEVVLKKEITEKRLRKLMRDLSKHGVWIGHPDGSKQTIHPSTKVLSLYYGLSEPHAQHVDDYMRTQGDAIELIGVRDLLGGERHVVSAWIVTDKLQSALFKINQMKEVRRVRKLGDGTRWEIFYFAVKDNPFVDVYEEIKKIEGVINLKQEEERPGVEYYIKTILPHPTKTEAVNKVVPLRRTCVEAIDAA